MKYIRPSVWSDVEYLSDKLRAEDQQECMAGGYNPSDALALSYNKSSVCFTLLEPDTWLPGAMMGVGPSQYEDFGLIWLLGTPSIAKHSMIFLKQSKQGLDMLFELTGYEGLYNTTYAGNTLHHKWLKWLKFKFIREITSINNETFYEFAQIRSA